MKSRWCGVALLLLSTTLSAQASTAHICRVYFQEADKFLAYISTRDDLKHNMPEINGNFEQNKKQISAASLTKQKEICEKGMLELKSLNEMFGPKEANHKK